MSAPRCLYCGNSIAKRTKITFLRTRKQADRGIGGRDWLTVEELPATKEEAQRLTNHRITYVRFAPPATGARGINEFTTWDGESYAPRHGHFDKIDCAARFGRLMADRGARK